jgi:RNA polymerase sigma-70 factor (ECF subfamily)
MTDPSQVQLYTQLWTTVQSRVYGLLLALVHDRHAAQDLTQEVAMLLWQKFDTFGPDSEPHNYLNWTLQTARYCAANWRRRHHKRALPLSNETFELLADEAQRLSSTFDDRLDALRECLATLPTEKMQLLRSYYGQERRVAIIAAERGVSVQAIYRAIQRLDRSLLECIHRKLAEAGA